MFRLRMITFLTTGGGWLGGRGNFEDRVRLQFKRGAMASLKLCEVTNQLINPKNSLRLLAFSNSTVRETIHFGRMRYNRNDTDDLASATGDFIKILLDLAYGEEEGEEKNLFV
jgi:hypothetical protein